MGIIKNVRWVRGTDGHWREEFLPGRVIGQPMSNRIGKNSGQKCRTFHAQFSSVRCGQNNTVRGAVDYIGRDGDFKHKDKDLEIIVGNKDDFNAAANAIENSARVKRGKTAEKIIMKMTFELPIEMNKKQRAETAQDIVEHYRSRGYMAIAAVHCNDLVQPHIHLLVSARPIQQKNHQWIADRTPGQVIAQNKSALKDERNSICNTINNVMDRHGLGGARFFAGKDIQMDEPGIIDRKPLRRVPTQDYLAGQRAQHPTMVAHVAEIKSTERQAAAIDRKNKLEATQKKEAAREQKRAALLQRTPNVRETKTEKAVRLATEKQRAMISAMAHERGLALPAGALDRLDSGDLIGAVRGLVEDFADRIAAAETRAAKAEAQAAQLAARAAGAREQVVRSLQQRDEARRERDEARRQAAPQEAARSPLEPPAPPQEPAAPPTARPLSVFPTPTQAEFAARLSAARATVAGLDNPSLMATLAATRAELAATPQARHNTRQGLQTGIDVATSEAQRRGLLAQPHRNQGRER